MMYHCISLQHLQSGHSCVDEWGWCYTPVEMTQCLYTSHCPGRWALNHYQRKLHGEVESLIELQYIHDNDILNNTLRYHKYTNIAYFYHQFQQEWIFGAHYLMQNPLVHRSLVHPVCPSGHHKLFHRYCCGRSQLCPHWEHCHSQATHHHLHILKKNNE